MAVWAPSPMLPFPVADPFADAMENHRRELTGYCYRMLGAGSEAEDAVQETFLRAWRARENFERRATLRSWLYQIATNVCLDMPAKPQRRARPMDLVSPSTTESAVLGLRSDDTWVQPISDDRALPDVSDPAELAGLRESIRLAFVAALQHLPPRQRVVLILREVLHWQAAEVAELLGDHRRLGQQRAAARPGHAGRAVAGERRGRAGRRRRVAAAGVRVGFRGVRHRALRQPAARRRRLLDAAARPVAARARSRSAAGCSGQGSAAAAAG